MKKIIFSNLLIACLIACNSKETNSGNLHISGNIEGLSQGKLYIEKIEDTTLVVLDSVIFNGDSNFNCFLNIKEPEVLYLFLDRGQTNSIDNSLPFFAEPGEITINSKLKEFYNAATISGSKNHDIWEKFKTTKSRFTNENLSIIQKRLENEANFNPKTQDSINKAYEKLLKRKYLYTANFAITNANYEIAPYLALTEIADINVAYLDTITVKLTPKVANSKYGKLLKEHIKNTKETSEN